MPGFSLKEIEQVNGKIKFFKLMIEDNCQFDDFCNEIERDGNLNKELVSLYSIMDSVANLKMLPKEKFRDITPQKDSIKEYEIKKGILRVYCIKDKTGNLIIYGGKKDSQKEDIKRFRIIKKNYLNSL